MKETAVDWLANEINKMNVSREATFFINKLKKQAKQMEKNQIKEAFIVGNSAKGLRFGSEKYYNQTYLEI